MTRTKILRDVVIHPEFREDLEYWVRTERKTALRIFKLIEAVMRDPFTGLGQPEPLKHLDSNTWSRQITKEHRLVYLVSQDYLVTTLRVVMPPGRSASCDLNEPQQVKRHGEALDAERPHCITTRSVVTR